MPAKRGRPKKTTTKTLKDKENARLSAELEQLKKMMAQLIHQHETETIESNEMPVGNEKYSSKQLDQLSSIGTGRTKRVDLKLARNEIYNPKDFIIPENRNPYKKVKVKCSVCKKMKSVDPDLLGGESKNYRCDDCIKSGKSSE